MKMFTFIYNLHMQAKKKKAIELYRVAQKECDDWSLISRTSSIKRYWFLFYYVENSFSNKMRQCHFQNLVLFRPHHTLEHNKILISRPPVALTEHLLWKRRHVNKGSYSLRNSWFSGTPWSETFLAVPRIARIEKVANLENDIASLK